MQHTASLVGARRGSSICFIPRSQRQTGRKVRIGQFAAGDVNRSNVWERDVRYRQGTRSRRRPLGFAVKRLHGRGTFSVSIDGS
jgi:hypothetical protein